MSCDVLVHRQFLTGQKGTYVVGSPIGQGASKKVYKGTLRMPDGTTRAVAILCGKETTLKTELAALKLCEGSPYVIKALEEDPIVLENGRGQLGVAEAPPKADPLAWIATELCDEGDFIQWSRGKTVRQRLKLLLDVAIALRELHERSLGHRDVKPANIGVKKDSAGNFHGVLMDCGTIMGIEEWQKNPASHCEGTPAYMSPTNEFREQDSPPASHDVYSLGATVFEACQRRVIPGDLCDRIITTASIEDVRPEIATYVYWANESQIATEIDNADIVTPIKDLLFLMMSTDPQKRCTIEEVITQISNILKMDLPELDADTTLDEETLAFTPQESLYPE